MDLYKVTSWGAPIGIGVSQSMYLHLSAIGKTFTGINPFYVVNELIAGEIGRRVRLPVPPFCVVQDASSVAFFASLDFNLTGITLPPIIPSVFAVNFPAAVGSILVFDIYICNSDRHRGNLSTDYSSNRYNLFDHSHAVLGGSHHGLIGESRLAALANSLVIDAASGVGNRHCLLDMIDNDQLMAEMLSRIEGLDEYFLTDIVEAAEDYGLPAASKPVLLDFLLDRRTRVRQLIAGSRHSFPTIHQWSLL